MEMRVRKLKNVEAAGMDQVTREIIEIANELVIDCLEILYYGF